MRPSWPGKTPFSAILVLALLIGPTGAHAQSSLLRACGIYEAPLLLQCPAEDHAGQAAPRPPNAILLPETLSALPVLLKHPEETCTTFGSRKLLATFEITSLKQPATIEILLSGTRPAPSWLDGSRLLLRRGIPCE